MKETIQEIGDKFENNIQYSLTITSILFLFLLYIFRHLEYLTSICPETFRPIIYGFHIISTLILLIVTIHALILSIKSGSTIGSVLYGITMSFVVCFVAHAIFSDNISEGALFCIGTILPFYIITSVLYFLKHRKKEKKIEKSNLSTAIVELYRLVKDKNFIQFPTEMTNDGYIFRYHYQLNIFTAPKIFLDERYENNASLEINHYSDSIMRVRIVYHKIAHLSMYFIKHIDASEYQNIINKDCYPYIILSSKLTYEMLNLLISKIKKLEYCQSKIPIISDEENVIKSSLF